MWWTSPGLLFFLLSENFLLRLFDFFFLLFIPMTYPGLVCLTPFHPERSGTRWRASSAFSSLVCLLPHEGGTPGQRQAEGRTRTPGVNWSSAKPAVGFHLQVGRPQTPSSSTARALQKRQTQGRALISEKTHGACPGGPGIRNRSPEVGVPILTHWTTSSDPR